MIKPNFLLKGLESLFVINFHFLNIFAQTLLIYLFLTASGGPFLIKLCNSINIFMITNGLSEWLLIYCSIKEYTFYALYLFYQHLERMDLLYFKSGI